MKANIRLLERKVLEVVERLRDTARERDRLQGELEALRSRLGEEDGPRAERAEDALAPGWATRPSEIRKLLREAIEELRAE